MTVRYVGPGGSDSNNGLSWANRKLTLNGVEDTPVAAGDVVYVGPGTYRETLTIDIDGSSGSPITYIGDITGEHTDGVGGVVRITASDNDQSVARSAVFGGTSYGQYRTFRGFTLEGGSGAMAAYQVFGQSMILEDCQVVLYANALGLVFEQVSGLRVRRNLFIAPVSSNVYIFQINSGTSNQDVLIENNVFLGGNIPIYVTSTGGITVRNNLFLCNSYAIRVAALPQAMGVYNNIFYGSSSTAVRGGSTSDITENYNTFSGNAADRNTVNVGAQSVTYLYQPQFLLKLVQAFPLAAPGPWAAYRSMTDDNSPPADDFFGLTRPATNGKRSWGPIEHQPVERATNITNGSSPASLKLADAGRHQMILPITAESTTITAQVYREADYAGTLPQMVIKQPGQSDNSDTDTGNAGAWNELSVTLTPAASPPYVVVELVSNNTATSGSYGVYFDDVEVT